MEIRNKLSFISNLLAGVIHVSNEEVEVIVDSGGGGREGGVFVVRVDN